MRLLGFSLLGLIWLSTSAMAQEPWVAKRELFGGMAPLHQVVTIDEMGEVIFEETFDGVFSSHFVGGLDSAIVQGIIHDSKLLQSSSFVDHDIEDPYCVDGPKILYSVINENAEEVIVAMRIRCHFYSHSGARSFAESLALQLDSLAAL